MAGNINTLMAVFIDVDAATNNDYTVTRGLEIIDIFTLAAAATAGTVNVQTNVSGAGLANAMTAAITPVADQIQYAATLLDAQLTLTAGDTIRGIGSAAGTHADLVVEVIPTTWIAG